MTLIQIFNDRIRVGQFGWATQVEVVGFLAPAGHWAPGWHFKVKGTRLIGQVADAVGDGVQLSVLIETPDLELELWPTKAITSTQILTIPALTQTRTACRIRARRRKSPHRRHRLCGSATNAHFC